MPRRRMIDPDIWHDTWFGNLTERQQVFFIGIISNCDDEGRILANPTYLRSRIFIYHDVPAEEIQSMLSHFNETNPNFHLYSINGDNFIQLLKWREYQKPQYPKPSKIPAPIELVKSSIVKSSIVKSSVVASLNESENNTMNESMNESMNEFDIFVEEKRKQFPELDLDLEKEKFYLYWSEGNKELKRPKQAFLNWLEKARQIRQENGKGRGNNPPRALPKQYTRPEDL